VKLDCGPEGEVDQQRYFLHNTLRVVFYCHRSDVARPLYIHGRERDRDNVRFEKIRASVDVAVSWWNFVRLDRHSHSSFVSFKPFSGRAPLLLHQCVISASARDRRYGVINTP